MKITEFPLAWRWTQESHDVLPQEILETMVPLSETEASELHTRVAACVARDGHRDPSRFRAVTIFDASGASSAARSWLEDLAIAGSQGVVISWDQNTALEAPWPTFSTFWSAFCYPASDDVLVQPREGDWLLKWNHEEVFEFGSQRYN
jgi:hypothetical protein